MPVVPVTNDYEAPPEDLLPEGSRQTAKVVAVKEKTINWIKDGEAKSTVLLNWTWEIVEGQYAGRKVWGTTNNELELKYKNNRFRDTVETLLSRELKPEDPPLDTDDLIDMIADITIQYRADKRDPEKKYVEVGDVLPAGDSVFTINEDPPF